MNRLKKVVSLFLVLIMPLTISILGCSNKSIQKSNDNSNIAQTSTAKDSKEVTLVLGDPVIVAQSETNIKQWGPYQFPKVERLADGRLHISYSVSQDSARAYGNTPGHAVSSDNGKTWNPDLQFVDKGGLLLKNGDRLRSKVMPSISVFLLGFDLPASDYTYMSYNTKGTVYPAAVFPDNLKGWIFSRLEKGKSEWVDEQGIVNIPGETRYETQAVVPLPYFWRMRIDKDGGIWGITYMHRIENNTLQKYEAIFEKSLDNGKTWKFVSSIPYKTEKDRDVFENKREGFTEPDISFMPDGSILSLLRTTDGYGMGPSYWSRSTDQGKTWSEPKYYDDRGVWPTLLTLKNGVTISVYGRPGLYVRATKDPSGQEWGSRVSVVDPMGNYVNTCAYGDLIALDDNTALLTYSDFTVRNKDGDQCKSIMARTITVVSK